jgi:hypothetical protein
MAEQDFKGSLNCPTVTNGVCGRHLQIIKVSSGALTTEECAGTIVLNYGMTDADCIIALPAASEGLSFICMLPTVRARYFRLSAALTDKINLLIAGLWVAGSDNGYIGVASGYVAGATVSIFSAIITDGTYEWFALPVAGTWVAA